MLRHALLLTLSPLIWGWGFVATRYTLDAYPPLWANTYRFLLATAILVPVLWPRLRRTTRREWRLAGAMGVPLAASFAFQTLGLVHTTVARSSFITCLYAVFVPLLAIALGRERVRAGHFALVGVALAGLALLTGMAGGDPRGFGRGELLTLLCAFFGAVQIVAADAAAQAGQPFLLNALQTFWMAGLSAVGALALEGAPPAPSFQPRVLGGLVFLAVPSTIVAFGLQLYAQRRLAPATAAMVFLLEAPFGALAGLVALGERGSPAQWLGSALVLGACAGAVWLGIRGQKVRA